MNSLKKFVFLFSFVVFCLCPAQSLKAQTLNWYESNYKHSTLEKKYQLVRETYDSNKFQALFSKQSIQCEAKVIRELLALGVRNVKYGILLANRQGMIDEVETDIFLAHINYLKTHVSPVDKLGITKGTETIAFYYKKMFNSSTCVSDLLAQFQSKVSIQQFDDQDSALSFLNQYANIQNHIDHDELLILEMIRMYRKNFDRALSIKSYHRKKQQLAREGFTLNAKVMPFHNAVREKGTVSSRYNIYNNFSLLQIKEIHQLIKRLNDRFNSASSEILFIDNEGNVREQIKLNHTEQIRLGLKLYQREKHALLLKDYFKGTQFTYRDLITIAYEVGEINDSEIDVFAQLETKVKKKTFWQKATTFATKLDFLAAALGGPLVGVAYSLTFSLIDSLVNKKDAPKPRYDHDIFYGNCEMRL